MNQKAIEEARLIADNQCHIKHQMIMVHTIRDLCRRLEEADQVIEQRNAMLSAQFQEQRPTAWVGLEPGSLKKAMDHERHNETAYWLGGFQAGALWAEKTLRAKNGGRP